MGGSFVDFVSSEWEKRLEKSHEKAKNELEKSKISELEEFKSNYQKLAKVHGDLSVGIISDEPTKIRLILPFEMPWLN